jgi:predicted enzyme related to lactoylglutathione lyase
MIQLINWFELPVLDFNRARLFYEHVFQMKMPVGPMGEYLMGFFPSPSGPMGAIVQGEGYVPSVYGPRLFLNANPNLDEFLVRALEAGAQLIVPKTFISEDVGYCAYILDPEGNAIALNSLA